jgi:hypothetical protein
MESVPQEMVKTTSRRKAAGCCCQVGDVMDESECREGRLTAGEPITVECITCLIVGREPFASPFHLI